jgi:aspartate aminotransferase
VEECLKKDIYIIYDECYEKFLYGDNKHITPLTVNKEAKKITLLVNSISKTYAMPGYRIGYALGPQEVIKAMANIQSQFTSSPSSISQKAALQALSTQDDFLKPIVKEYKEKRDMVVAALNNIKGVKCALPEGAFYVFPDVSSYLHNGKFSNTIELAEYLLNKANVAIVPGDAFGRPGFIRMCYATPRDIITGGLEAMKKCLEDIEK